MASDGGVWVKMGNAAPAGAAVINDASSNYDNKDAGVTIDGKTYDVYTFNTATTTRSVRLTNEARARITDEDLLMAVATTPIPDDFTGDPATLFDRKYRNQLRNAFDVTPAVDPGLTLDVETAGFVDVLLVAGGGGGGGYEGGGGGAGGMVIETIYLPKNNHNVTVGNGGEGGIGESVPRAGTSTSGANGAASGIENYVVAVGGGGGGAATGGNGARFAGNIGGSGGGGAGGNIGTAGLSYAFQGNAGGVNTTSDRGAGGGGGAGTVGGSGAANGGAGGDGVDIASFINSQTEMWVAGGGGGGTYNASGGIGGNGGGANGSNTSARPTDATANTGGGGGGGGYTGAGSACGPGSNGGSGIVIVRVEI